MYVYIEICMYYYNSIIDDCLKITFKNYCFFRGLIRFRFVL